MSTDWNKRLCDIMGIGSSDLLNAYVIGSQSTSDATKESDMDIVVVLSDDCGVKWRNVNWLRRHGWVAPPTSPKAFDNFKRCYKGCDEYDIWGYSKQSFQALLNEAVPFAVGCLFLDESSVLKSTVSFSMTAPPAVVFRSFTGVSALHLARAGMEFHASSNTTKPVNSNVLDIERWDPYKSVKSLYFSLWYLELARQLLADGSITYRSACVLSKKALLKVAPDLSQITCSDWKTFMSVFAPLHQKALSDLTTLHEGDPLWCYQKDLTADPILSCCCPACLALR
eukprot:TRINITY_DN20845_c0_g1_i1.p1 TRINITY_DN20845_c0_g1~~TRINITY_DN20845_c0_g1_i1.p1  ORF type:complete len:283 (+),score=23.99 TRINITY_DN20845_c0_g1_i1:47-895(+)